MTFNHLICKTLKLFSNGFLKSHKYLQNLFGWGGQGVGSRWQDLDVIGLVMLGGQHNFPIWDIEVWNHLCIMLDSVTENINLVMNGKTVLNDNLKEDISILDHNLSLMGNPIHSGYILSFFGGSIHIILKEGLEPNLKPETNYILNFNRQIFG